MTHNNWPTVKLGDVASLEFGAPFKSKQFNEERIGLPVARIRDVKRRYSETFYEGPFEEKYLLENGDLLVGMDGEFNIARWQGGKALLNQRVCRIGKHPNPCVLPMYLYYCLPRHLKVIEERKSFVTVKHLSAKDLRSIEIPLPPLEEQRRIAEMLDATSRMIETTKTVEDNLENFAKAAYSEFFSGFESPEVLLTEVGKSKDAIKCGPFGTQLKQADFQTQGVPLIGIKSVNSRFELSPWEFLAREKAEQLASYDVRPGDILMTRKGTIGNCSLYPRSLPHGIMHSDLLRIRVDNPHINPVFLLHQLHYDHCIQSQIRKLSPGAVMPGINVGKLKKLKIRVPPIEFQERFAKVIQASDQTRAIVRAKLKALIELQSSLSARAFSGEL